MTASVVADAPNAAISPVRATVQLVMGAVGAQLLTALTFGLVARELGSSVFGLMVVLFGVGAVAQDCLDFGTSLWITRELTAGRVTSAAATSVLRRRTAVVLVIGIVCLPVAIALHVAALLAGSLVIYVFGAVANAGMYARLRAEGLFRRVALLTAVERAAWLAIAIGIVMARPPRDVAVVLLVASMGGIYLATTPFGPAKGDGGTGGHLRLCAVYRSAASFGVLGLSSDLQQLDATLVAPLAGISVAADVGIASKLSGPLQIAAGAITQVAFRSVAAGDEASRADARFALRMAGAVSLVVALVAPVLPAVVVALLGGQYEHARAAVLVYALGAAVGVINQPLTAVLSAAGKDRVVSWVVLAAVGLGLGLGVACAARLGAVGMGLGFVFTQLVIVSWCTVLYRRHLAR